MYYLSTSQDAPEWSGNGQKSEGPLLALYVWNNQWQQFKINLEWITFLHVWNSQWRPTHHWKELLIVFLNDRYLLISSNQIFSIPDSKNIVKMLPKPKNIFI